MGIIKKLQDKPTGEKKIILWSVIVIVGLILFIFWVNASKRTINSFDAKKVIEDINPPEIESFPEIDYDIDEEEFMKLLEEENAKETGK